MTGQTATGAGRDGDGLPGRLGSGVRTAFERASLRDYGIVFAFGGLFVLLSTQSDVFLSTANLRNLLTQSAPIGLMAIGGTLLLISGGFDLSVGAIFALSGIVAAQSAPILGNTAALLLGILVGLLVGVVNGVLATVGRINPLVTTLASAIVIRGVSLVLTGGFLVSVADPSFQAFGRGRWLGINISIVLWLGFALLAGLVLTFTTYGRRIYAAGGNPEAARLSGIRVNLVRTSTYAISGLSAGLAGVLISSRVATGQADAAIGIELSVIAAIVVGGTSIWGGDGAVWRTVLGVLILAMIGNGFNLLQVPAMYQQIIEGSIILAAVAMDAWSRRRST